MFQHAKVSISTLCRLDNLLNLKYNNNNNNKKTLGRLKEDFRKTLGRL